MRFLRSKYLQQLLAGRGNGMVKIITGVRRCGKSSWYMKTSYLAEMKKE